MSSLKLTLPEHWTQIEDHLASASGERFAFALTETLSDGVQGPVLHVVDVIIVDDSETEHDDHGWYISEVAVDRIHSYAAAHGCGLVEFHNHSVGPPGFSATDELALKPMVDYMLELLPGRPYGAAVYAGGYVHAEWWSLGAGDQVQRGLFRSVTVAGQRLLVLNGPDASAERHVRQLPLLGRGAQSAIATLRVAVVGVGGTGSHIALSLAYLGFRNLLLFEDDVVDLTNLNRLVTAQHADVGKPKASVAGKRIRAIDPGIQLQVLSGVTVGDDHPELHDVDLIIGCVDHDGPRHRLNQIALASRTPYIDIATGIDDRQDPVAIGGRVIFVMPDGPCLTCLDELDSAEIARWAKPEAQRAIDRQHGYGTGTPNPSVVYLNGLTCHAALAELAAWLSGARAPAGWLDIDLVGSPKQPGVQVGPRQVVGPRLGCIDCGGIRQVPRARGWGA